MDQSSEIVYSFFHFFCPWKFCGCFLHSIYVDVCCEV